MKRDEIRSRVFAPRERPTNDVQFHGAPIVLHKLSYRQIQEARRAAIVDDSFEVDYYNIARLILSSHDEEGQRVFLPTDRDELLEDDSEELDRLMQAMMDLHGETEKAVERGKELLRGTGDAGPSSGSAGSSGSSPESSSKASSTGSS